MHRTRALIVGLAVVAVVTSTAATSAVQAAPTPFTCNNDLYFLRQIRDGNVTSQVVHLTRSGTDITFDNIGIAIPGSLNGLAYNPADNFLYAADDGSGGAPGALYRIASDGSAEELGVPAGLDVAVSGFNSGSFIAPDTYILGSATYEGNTTLNFVDIPTRTVTKTVTTTAQFADFATNPLDGRVYGFDRRSGKLAYVDTVSGALTTFGTSVGENLMTVGSTWFLNSGQMLLYGTPLTGGSDQDRFYDADSGTNGDGTGALTELGTGPVAQGTDGASCVSLPEETTTTSSSTTTSTTAPIATSTTSVPTTTAPPSPAPPATPIVATVSYTG